MRSSLQPGIGIDWKEAQRMPLKDDIVSELKQTPIASTCAPIAVLIAALSLLLAWSQSSSSSVVQGAPTSIAIDHTGYFSLGNAALIISYFISATISASLILRAIAKKNDLAAFFASIPLIALTNFSSILIIYLAPPRALNTQLFTSAHDLVFYASAAIVITFFGKSVLKNFASVMPDRDTENKNESSNEGLGVLFLAAILLAIWSWLVFAGQTRMTQTLLPEITHSISKNLKKSTV